MSSWVQRFQKIYHQFLLTTFCKEMTMPQAIIMQVVMQVIQQLVQKLMSAIQKAMSENQSQQQMQQTAQQTMEADNVMSQSQQMDTLDQCEQESFNLGEFLMARVFADMKSNWTGGTADA
jgi:hypothetical protein